MTERDAEDRRSSPPPPHQGALRAVARVGVALGARFDRPLRRTIALAAALCVGSLLLLDRLGAAPLAEEQVRLGWFVFAVAFALAEVCVFHVELRREAHTFSLSEVPLVLGFFFGAPVHVVVGRLVGEALLLGLHERIPPRKLLLNLSAFLGETTVGLAVFALVARGEPLERPLSWLGALVAVLAADAVSASAVALAIRWHGGPTEPLRMVLTNVATAVTNTSLALTAALLLSSDPAALVLLVAMAALILFAYRGYTSINNRYESLQLLYDVTRLVAGSRRPEEVLEAILGKARELMRAEWAGIRLFDDGDGAEVWVAADDLLDHAGPSRPLSGALAAELAGLGHALVGTKDSRDPQVRRVLDALGVPDFVAAPLHANGEVIGVLVVTIRQGAVSTFDEQDGRLFETLANHTSVALGNGRLIDRLHGEARQREHEALHDALTGLPNRAMFEQGVRRALGDGQSFAVALMDLDHFKEVNDTLGHHSGDLLLQEVARRLQSALPDDVVVARLGGDEFALLAAVGSDADARALGNLVQHAVAAPYQLEAITLEVGASVGFALHPQHGVDEVTLMQRADVAMYTAKRSVDADVVVYEPQADIHTPRRLMLANDLRHAIDTGQLVLHYQPKVRVADGAPVGAEALVRWRHPELGFVPPDEFVPLAERTGLIVPFTDFVISSALDQLHLWRAQQLPLRVAINLSVRNLVDLDLPGRVEAQLRRRRLDPSWVTFEITESQIMSDPTKVGRVLEEFAQLGVQLSVDDFGTGYSSLAYLQRLAVDEVKVDKSFVQPLPDDANAAAIVRAVVSLGRSLGLTVVAEGVESQRVYDHLRELGCDEAQGYHLGRPVPPEQFLAWVRARREVLRVAGVSGAATRRVAGDTPNRAPVSG